MAEEMDEGAIATRESKVATPATLMVDRELMQLARENPRDEDAVFERVMKELMAHPTYADELFYSIPYKEKRKRLINFVEGPSIRAAEHLWSRWGNCTVAARVADDRGNKIMVQGLYLDHENGLRLFSDLEVAKMGTTYQGGTYPLSANDLRNKVAATESKVRRNAFLSAVPVWMKQQYVQSCFDLSMGVSKKTVGDRIVDAKVFFMSRFKVDEAAVLDLMARIRESYPGIAEKEVLRYLIGVKNGIKDGNIDSEFLFGESKPAASMPRSKKEAASGPAQSPASATTEEPAGDAQEE